MHIVVTMSQKLLEKKLERPGDTLWFEAFENCVTERDFNHWLESNSHYPGIEEVRELWGRVLKGLP